MKFVSVSQFVSAARFVVYSIRYVSPSVPVIEIPANNEADKLEGGAEVELEKTSDCWKVLAKNVPMP